jgi:hypothetical protein
LRIRIRDPVLSKSVDPGSEMEINPEPGSRDLIFENLVSVFWVKILKFCDAKPDPVSWMEKIRTGILDPG